MSLLHKKILNKFCLTVLPTRKLKMIFQRRNAICNTALMLQCKVMLHKISTTVEYNVSLVMNTISNTAGKFVKMVQTFW